jgi:hypothetical protein
MLKSLRSYMTCEREERVEEKYKCHYLCKHAKFSEKISIKKTTDAIFRHFCFGACKILPSLLLCSAVQMKIYFQIP